MTCHICKTLERDLNDVVRTLRKRIAAQVDASPSTSINLDLEIQALSQAKQEIEAKYLKHRQSCYASIPAEQACASSAYALT